jgi:hypothetical protein
MVSIVLLSLVFDYEMESEVENIIPCRLSRHTFYGIAGVLLMLLALGGWWQRQKAGAGTHAVLATVKHYCPSAVANTHSLSVLDGAKAIDRWGWLLSEKAIDQILSRENLQRCSSIE